MRDFMMWDWVRERPAYAAGVLCCCDAAVTRCALGFVSAAPVEHPTRIPPSGRAPMWRRSIPD